MSTRRHTGALQKRPLSRRSLASRASRVAVVAGVWLLIAAQSLSAAVHRTVNFEVSADSATTARLIARHAEDLRSTLAQEWLGEPLPVWPQRCLVRVEAGRDRLSGDTTYTIVPGRVTRWRMVLNGPIERIVETLLPHEVLHTILASHFQEAVPRWADEGAALSVEAEADRRRLWAQEGPRLLHGQRRPLKEMFAADSYPKDANELRAFYAQGAAITEFLLTAGKPRFLKFVRAGMQSEWEPALTTHYGFAGFAEFEAAWVDWLEHDRPAINLAAENQTLADAAKRSRPAPGLVVLDHQPLTPDGAGLPSGAAGVSRYGSP